MKYTIQDMQPFVFLDENRKLTSLNGYAFIDRLGHCIIIVYGEGRRDGMIKHLNGDTNELGIKYDYVELK